MPVKSRIELVSYTLIATNMLEKGIIIRIF